MILMLTSNTSLTIQNIQNKYIFFCTCVTVTNRVLPCEAEASKDLIQDKSDNPPNLFLGRRASYF